MNTNFNDYKEWLFDKELGNVFNMIIKLEESVLKIVENGEASDSDFTIDPAAIREILSTICKHLFLEDINKNGDIPDLSFEEYSSSNFPIFDKIKILSTEKMVLDKHIIQKLHDIRTVGNVFAHKESDNLDKTYNYVSKANLIKMLNDIAIVISWMKNKKQDIIFNSSIYYNRREIQNTVDLKINSNIKLEEDRGIKINDSSIVNLLYDEDVSFKIPIYQRGYDWSEGELRDLVSDLEKRLEEWRGGQIISFHFFGNISLISEMKDLGNKVIKIVDGQQRITTTIILLRSIYNRLNELHSSKVEIDENLSKFIESSLKIDRVDNELTVKVMNKIWNGEKHFEDLETKTNAFQTFKFFSDWLKEKEIEEVYALLESLSKFIIGINWVKDVDEFELFESLNAKGKRLTNFDIFKNYLFSLIDRSIESENSQLITRYFENIIESKFDKLSQTKSVSMKDRFMQDFIFYNTGTRVNKKFIFSPFKDALKKWCGDIKIEDIDLKLFKSILLDLSRFIDATILTVATDISTWLSNDALSPFAKHAFFIVESPGYAQLLQNYFITSENIIYDNDTGKIIDVVNKEELKQLLWIMEVWRVRREISYNSGTKTMGGMILPLLRKFNLIKEDHLSALKDLIKSQDGDLILPSLDMFKDDLLNKGVNSKSIAGIILYRIHEKFSGEDENLEIDYKSFNIIEPSDSKRSAGWESFISENKIDDRSNLIKVGNFVIHNNDRKFKHFPKYDYKYLYSEIVSDNISLNKYGTYDIESVNSLPKLGIDETLKKRTEKIAEYAYDIFDF